ncbi:hypothetical protein JCM19240_5980 [Vibrio maritimus]|uniref:Uncharacterized protein n=1 Tax=Vibrio maritimus TaxID=990268 RepID=A0A090T062_9VIBR|nr:hypothetical protein JCM19240_5980 [Vibrio maritimus]
MFRCSLIAFTSSGFAIDMEFGYFDVNDKTQRCRAPAF